MKIASAPTKDRLQKLINEFFYSSTHVISEDNKVYNAKGLTNVKIEKKGERLVASINISK